MFSFSSRRENFQVELRAGILELLPGEANLAGLLDENVSFAERQ